MSHKLPSQAIRSQITYTMSLSQSAQMFCPGGKCGCAECRGCCLISGADTCLRPATGTAVVDTLDSLTALLSCTSRCTCCMLFSEVTWLCMMVLGDESAHAGDRMIHSYHVKHIADTDDYNNRTFYTTRRYTCLSITV